MKLKSVVKLKLFTLVSLLSRIFRIQNKKIVVDNFLGRGFGDNPKYIVKQLLKLDNSLDIVWLINNRDDLQILPKGVRTVKYYSLRSAYEYATARIWIDNIKNNYKGVKRKGQFYLQTWHGGIGFKKVEKAAADTLDKSYIIESKYDSKQTNLMISDSDWVTDNYRKNFWYDGPIIKTGLPRNDVFFTNVDLIKDKVRAFYDIDKDTEIILYAPTFRKYKSLNKQAEICSFNEEKIIDAFEKSFNKKFIVIKRFHPNVANYIGVQENKVLKDGSKYPDMQELLLASFALITDFSSCVFDFILKSNRVFLFANDYDEYVYKERGMMFDLKEDLPFSFSNNESDLIKNISDFDDNVSKNKLYNFKKQVGLLEDGKASQRVAEVLLKNIMKG